MAPGVLARTSHSYFTVTLPGSTTITVSPRIVVVSCHGMVMG
jgi:hypothetical protein